ncbi:MAG: sugar ABC transporter substrate-binding protein [Lachnospiraceae bacterium]|nr:sugar ABC transporter substrate-binding protein [Lachnospiraceae bacterium]
MRKRTLALAMAAVMGLTTACSGGSQSAQTTAAPTAAETTAKAAAESKGEESKAAEAEITEPVTIKFANYALLEAGYDAYWNQLLDEFKKQNPNITVELVTAPYGEIVNTVVNMAGGGDMVDLMYGELDWIPTMVEAGMAAPVGDVLSEELVADIYPNILDACKIDGEAYGVPMYVSPFLMYYNKDLFEKAGLDPNTPPTTYDEMLEIAPKLAALTTDDGNKVYAFGLTTASVPVSGACLTSSIHNFGGTVLDADGNLAIDQGFKDAVSMWKTLHDKGYNPENSKLKDLRNLFALGQLAMYYDQSWGFNGVKSINPDAADFIASAAPLKGGNGNGESVLQAGTLMVMNNGDARKAATAKLVDYILSEEKISQYFETVTPAYPSRQSMEDLEVVKNSAILAGAAGAVGNVKPVTFIPTLSDLNLEICTLAQAVTVSGTDVDKAIVDFETAAKGVIE